MYTDVTAHTEGADYDGDPAQGNLHLAADPERIHAKLHPLGYACSIGVTLGANVHFYGMPSGMFVTERWLITIGNEVYIGLRTLIMPGVTIGSRVIIGAGSTVTHHILDNSLAARVPARVIKTVDEFLEQMKKKSLPCGHFKGLQKEAVLKRIFEISTSASVLE